MSSLLHSELQNRRLSDNIIREGREIASKSAKQAQVVIRKMDERLRTEVIHGHVVINAAGKRA